MAHITSAHRLHNQQITAKGFDTPNALVQHLGAVQAQDYPMSKWAIGLRLPNATDTQIEEALNTGQLVRTHVLRPTWHIVAGQDVRWMLALTAKQIKASSASRDRDLGIDTALYHKTNNLIARALEGNKNLTRAEVMQELEKGGIKTDPSRAVHFMMNAEVDGIVCNGPWKGKELSYALMDEKIPKGLSLTREESISELAKRYFLSHSPATLHDFNWWSGLPMADARAGLESIKTTLRSFEQDGRTYFMPKDSPDVAPTDSFFFLPAFDEYCVSYKNRDAVFRPDLQKEAITGNGIFKPIVVVNGQVVGIWKRAITGHKVIIETTFFDNTHTRSTSEIAQRIATFGAFLGKTVVVK